MPPDKEEIVEARQLMTKLSEWKTQQVVRKPFSGPDSSAWEVRAAEQQELD